MVQSLDPHRHQGSAPGSRDMDSEGDIAILLPVFYSEEIAYCGHRCMHRNIHSGTIHNVSKCIAICMSNNKQR